MGHRTSIATKKRKPQARGDARRQELLNAAETLLLSQEFDEVSMADIARQAEIPTASCYSLFSNSTAVFSQLNNRYSQKFVATLSSAVRDRDFSSWMEIMDYCCDFMVDFYEQHPSFSRIMLSGKAPSEVRYSRGRIDGSQHAQQLLEFISSRFSLPVIEDPLTKFTVTVDLIDGIVASGFIREGRISETVLSEAKRAVQAYLKLYIPTFLPRNNMPRKNTQ
ncbi:MAG: hypothetical protein VXZ35_01925 [Pseudomonadota bacterium]|nr:hypothetical protein [Pseudomonadota bacterium]